MDALVNAFIAIGLLLILVLIVYLVDRVNTIEKETRQMAQSMNRVPEPVKDPFAGLAGKKLWDAMTGKPPEAMAPEVLADVRERYDLVLHKHLESLYKEGWRDGERGLSAEPPNTRVISTAAAQVESWLPSAQVKTIYQCGLEASQRPPELWDSLRLDMDEAASILYDKTQLEVRQALSAWLMPAPVPPVAAENVPNPQTTSQASQAL
jgi:hypothetical protein